MKIGAITSAMSSYCCQPVNRVEFAKNKNNNNDTPFVQEDVFASNDKIMAQKYDLACRLAAYYKTQYEQLKETGCCMA